MIRETISFTFQDAAQQQRFHDRLNGVQLVPHLGPDRTADLLDRMGLLLVHIAETIAVEGDRAVLNSTNDADRIRALAEEWLKHCYDLAGPSNG